MPSQQHCLTLLLRRIRHRHRLRRSISFGSNRQHFEENACFNLHCGGSSNDEMDRGGVRLEWRDEQSGVCFFFCSSAGLAGLDIAFGQNKILVAPRLASTQPPSATASACVTPGATTCILKCAILQSSSAHVTAVTVCSTALQKFSSCYNCSIITKSHHLYLLAHNIHMIVKL